MQEAKKQAAKGESHEPKKNDVTLKTKKKGVHGDAASKEKRPCLVAVKLAGLTPDPDHPFVPNVWHKACLSEVTSERFDLEDLGHGLVRLTSRTTGNSVVAGCVWGVWKAGDR